MSVETVEPGSGALVPPTPPAPAATEKQMFVAGTPTYESHELAGVLARLESVDVNRLAATVVLALRNMDQMLALIAALRVEGKTVSKSAEAKAK